MAHGLTIRADGTAEFVFAGPLPWHRLGTQAEGLMKPHDALKRGHGDWLVERKDMFYRNGDGRMMQADDRFAIVRKDTTAYLGSVGPNYEPLQNAEQADFIDALIGEGATVETFGTLWGGKKTFWACKVPKASIQLATPGFQDKVDGWLTLVNAHDGTMSFRSYFTKIRVVCHNTLTASLRGARKEGVWIRHTKNIRDRVKTAQQILGLAVTTAKTDFEVYSAMANARMSKDDFNKILADVFSLPEEATERAKDRQKEIVEVVTSNLSQETKALARDRVTAWDAFNAITFYTSHQRTPGQRNYGSELDRASAKFESIMYGSRATIQQDAFNHLTAFAAQGN